MTSYLIFSFLPTDPTSVPSCSVEQGINLAWPNISSKSVRQIKKIAYGSVSSENVV